MTVQHRLFRPRFLRLVLLFTTTWFVLSIGCHSPDVQRFQGHINYLADDSLEGRGLGSPGIDQAAKYIATQFSTLGLASGVPDGSYFQPFPITLNRTLTPASTLTFGAEDSALKLKQDFIPLSFSSDEAFSGNVLFCGYGIEAAEKNHHDFAGVDLASRVVVMFMGEPPSWADANGFPTRYSLLRDKVYNAKDRRALAVVFVNQTPPAGDMDELTEFDAEDPDEYGIPTFHLTRAVVDAQLAKVGLRSLDALQQDLDAGQSKSMEFPR
ncbi:MAG: PA domain-containing protein [Planctomycetota bacterium]